MLSKQIVVSAINISLEETIQKNKNVLISTTMHSELEERVLTIEVVYHRDTASTINSLEVSNLMMTNYDLGCVAFGLQDNFTVKSVNISCNRMPIK